MFHAFDMVAGLPNSARWAVVVMLAGMELLSAIKNTAKLGHNKLADALEGVYLTLMKSQPALKDAQEPAKAEVGASKEVATAQEGARQIMKKLSINQNKLEIAVAIGFSLIILILSNTEISYVPISQYRSLDLAVIPAIFAAMIGGYRVGIPVAVVWAINQYYNPASDMQAYSLLGLLVYEVIFLVSATWFYKLFKKIYIRSPFNVYRTIVAAVLVKNLVGNCILAYSVENFFKLELWLRHGIQVCILEMALCLLSMALLIKHLRQVHILNGVRRKNKKEES
ncbi:hypothetical protein QO179_24485 [Bacillus stercoris]|nr:hypothetical protein [Bacillus stercoris]